MSIDVKEAVSGFLAGASVTLIVALIFAIGYLAGSVHCKLHESIDTLDSINERF